MPENIYGGISYPNTSFIFDKICNNYAEAIRLAEEDGVLIGRYILIRYCETPLTQDIKNGLENGLISPTTNDEIEYLENYNLDKALFNNGSYDRFVCRKTYNPKTGYNYMTLASLNTTIGQDTINEIGNDISKIKQDLNLEIGRAEIAENNISNSIKAEEDRAKNQEINLNNKISETNSNVKTLQGNLETQIGRLNTLINNDEGKSIREIANDELTQLLIPENAKDSLDTLQEIADWIQEHPDDASSMNTEIQKLQKQMTWGNFGGVK